MREGDRIGGYRLLRQIGEGGMGVVWMASHGVLGRRAAIKILRAEFSTQHDTVTRFFNEACAAAAISDPGIIQIFDVGRHNGSAFIVMELLDGETLDARIKRIGALPVVPALRLCRQIASAIGAAHERGIIHRDLKPENIFVVRDPEVTGGERTKVLDFGIAKLAGNIGRQHRTNTAVVMGTPRYMSPEQCRGGGTPVDQRSDIYSLGCVLYTLVVGHPPFDTMATGVLIMQHMSDPPPRPSSSAPNVPAELDELLLRCLAKEPAHRPGTGTELAVAIDALLALPAVINAPPPAHVAPSIAPSATTLDQLVTYVTPASLLAAVRGRRRRLRRIALVMGAVAAAAIAVTLLRSGPEPSAASAAPPAPPAPPITAPRPAPEVPDLRPEVTRADLRAMLAAFARWSETHPAAVCPTAAELGAARDPWQHPYAVTCTDQPADQVVGVRSAGADGAMETDDDIVSWNLDDAMKLARGPRWKPVIAPAPT
ncbi:MAG TPA: serine/threonine-protein kinase, partial [Kofleriaceae bacterium]|nr:serine/threonine-protein kinase [Kofleriaceae bacterium]